MNIYISSTLTDLAHYRLAVAKALRQIGHRVVHMEEYTADETRPLDRCLKDVASADVYVGIFAWRYGYIPPKNSGKKDLPTKFVPGETSITEAEYMAAEGKPRLMFLLSDSEAWPPLYMDAHTAEDKGAKINRLRASIGENHSVSYFTSPDHLAKEVMAAVQRQEISIQLELKSLQAVDAHRWMMNPESPEPHGLSVTTMMSITEQIQIFDNETYMIIDLGAGRNWWSTRLYFLSSLLVDLTDVRLLVFIDREKHLFGVSSAVAVSGILGRHIQAIRSYEEHLAMESPQADLEAEIKRRGTIWEDAMQAAGGEASVKTWVRKQELRRFLGDALIQRAVDWSEAKNDQDNRALEVVDEVIKWPQDRVPLVRDGLFYRVVERNALTEEVASFFVQERLRGSN